MPDLTIFSAAAREEAAYSAMSLIERFADSITLLFQAQQFVRKPWPARADS